MKNLLITLIFFLLSAGELLAQRAYFISSGTIEYQKSSNMYALMKKTYAANTGGPTGIFQTLIEQYQKTNPQFKVLKSTLTFADNKTLFTPIVPDVPPAPGFNSPMSDQLNTVYTDLNTQTSTLVKNIADASFVMKDSVRKIVWKITNETRDIAGFSCRRANGLVLDSIYIVAFYTVKIPLSGGPESFNGLPGMILEVAVPNEHVTWLATKVTGMDIPAPTIAPPKKGKVVNNKQLVEFIKGLNGGRAEKAQIDLMMKAYLL